MRAPEIPSDEVERLRSLQKTALLDTAAEERFDCFTRLAQQLCGTKYAFISLVDKNRQWFKSKQGLEVCETSREVSFCGHAILSDQLFVVEDAIHHPDFKSNPLVLGEPYIRLYAGAPIKSPEGYKIGTLCVIDDQSRSLNEAELNGLKDLANCINREIARKDSLVLNDVLAHSEDRLLKIISSLNDEVFLLNDQGDILPFTRSHSSLALNSSSLEKRCQQAKSAEELFPSDVWPTVQKQLKDVFESGSPQYIDFLERRRHLKVYFSAHLSKVNETELLLIISDVTKFKSTEEALREERELFSSGPVCTIVWSPQENWPVTYASENIENLLGYSPKELTAPSFRFADLIHPNDIRRITAEVNSNITGNVDQFEQSYRIQHVNGDYRWFYDFAKLIRDVDGKVESIRGYMFDQSQLKESEIALAEGRRRLSDIIEGTRIGTWEWNVQTGETVFNNRWAEIVGYTLEELAPVNIDTWLELAHPDDLERSGKMLQDCFSRKIIFYDIEARMRHKEGYWVWVHDRGKVVSWTDDGSPLLMSGTHADITEKKRAEEAIAEYAEFQKLIFDNLPVYLFIKDKNFRIVQANSKFLAMYPESEQGNVIGADTFEQYGPSEKDLFLTEDKKAFRDGFSEVEEQVTFPNGEEKILWTKKIRFENRQGEEFILGLSSDITERKHYESIQSELRTRLSVATSAAGIGIWEWRVEDDEIAWDDRMYDLYDLEKSLIGQSITSKDWLQLIHDKDRERTTIKIKNALVNADRIDLSYRIVTPRGKVRYVTGAAKVQRDSNSKPIRMIGTNWDITPLKEAEQALIKAKSEAEAAVHAKSEFLANMSHEIRTPMNGVLGMLDLVLKSSLSAKQRRQIELSQQSAQSLLAVINDILDFSKIEAGKLEIESVQFNFIEFISEFVELMAYSAQKKGLEIILDVTELESEYFVGDPIRLRQILSNLVGNAVKFTSTGEITIKLIEVSHSDNCLQLQCTIEDSGIGIAPEKIPLLFSAFSQADSSTTREFGGTGLGLAIVQKLCEMMNGSIQIQSEVNVGTKAEFHILLECATDKDLRTYKDYKNIKNALVLTRSSSAANVLRKELGLRGVDANIDLCGSAHFDNHYPIEKLFESVGNEDFSLVIFEKGLLNQKMLQALHERFQGSQNNAFFIKLCPVLAEKEEDNIVYDFVDAVMYSPVSPISLDETLSVLERRGKPASRVKLSAQNSTRSISSGGEKLLSGKVLLVEDNMVNREVALGLLEDHGLEVSVCENGLEALNHLRNSQDLIRYDLIFMDCQMPKMDGYQTSLAIRGGEAGERYINIPIVAMTANAMKGDKEKCFSAGMNGYLSKPLFSEELKRQIEKYIRCASDESLQTSRLEFPVDHAENWKSSELLSRVNGREDRAIKLVNIYLMDTEFLVRDLKNAVLEQDLGQVAFLAHSLKGSSSNLGAHRLEEYAGQIEQGSRIGNAAVVTVLLQKLLHAYESTCLELMEFAKKS